MRLNSALETLRTDLRHFGVVSTAHDIAVRLLNRKILYRCMKVMAISRVNPVPPLPQGYRFEAIPAETLRAFSVDPIYEITTDFADQISNGAHCYGVFHDDVLTNYVSFTTKPTVIFDHFTARVD